MTGLVMNITGLVLIMTRYVDIFHNEINVTVNVD